MIIDKCLHSKSLKCHPTEEEARPLYTRKKFAIFEEEFKQAMTYKCKVGCAGMTSVYLSEEACRRKKSNSKY